MSEHGLRRAPIVEGAFRRQTQTFGVSERNRAESASLRLIGYGQILLGQGREMACISIRSEEQ